MSRDGLPSVEWSLDRIAEVMDVDGVRVHDPLSDVRFRDECAKQFAAVLIARASEAALASQPDAIMRTAFELAELAVIERRRRES